MDNSEQQRKLRELYSLTVKRLNSLTSVLENEGEHHLMKQTMNPGRELMEEVRNTVNTMIEIQQKNKESKEAQLKENILYAPFTSLLFFLITIGILLLSYYKVNIDFDNQKNLHYAIDLQNKTFNHAETTSDQGTYSWDINANRISFSDNLYQLLDCEKKSVEPCIDDLMKLVIEEDRNLVKDYFSNKSFKEVNTIEFKQRLANGAIKNIRAIAVVKEGNSGPIVVGILQNISKEKENTKLLENYAYNLVQVNEKLQETQTFLTSLTKLIPNGISVYTPVRNKDGVIVDFKVKFFNQIALNDSQQNPEDVIGKSVLSIYPGVAESGYFDKLKQVVETGETLEFTIFYDYPELKSTWFQNYMCKIDDDVMITYVDVSEVQQKNAEIEIANTLLAAKNIELVNSNAELMSFNHIASHDLQEPLRKIQTFISRLKDNDGEHISTAGKLYFNRIENAATRMQKLIKDLLIFSNTGSENDSVVDVNLNEIVELVKDELSEVITSKEASITYDELPTIKGLEFQLQQLFTNFISNSLKYAKLDTAPVIKINYSKISSKALPEDMCSTSNYYHHIAIADNGIGFNEVYAKKIFQLFQRLHTKSEYEGTGIGLAICKKIVDIHNGFIAVNSEEGKGSTFNIYLPI